MPGRGRTSCSPRRCRSRRARPRTTAFARRSAPAWSAGPRCRRPARTQRSSPVGNAVEGKIAGGTFNISTNSSTGDLTGELSLELALGGPGKLRLDLIGARARASGISDTGLDRLVLAGGLPEEQLVPTFLGVLAWTVARDCKGTAPPDCGCEIGSSGRTILNLFDRSPQDCTLTVEEIQAADSVVFKLAPDLTINGRGAYSFGVELTAVKGTIRP